MSLSRSTMRLLYSVVKVHIARIVICYAVRAIRPARLRLAILALRVVFYSGSPSCFAVYAWPFASPLTVWIIAYVRLVVKMKFYRRVSDLETSRCSSDSLDYTMRPLFCQP